jgi:GT2 family glycosyltransferase
MSTQALDVGVVVLTRTRKALLDRCLASVGAQEPASAELVVVDNASEDDTVEMVRERFPRAKLIENPENLGIAARNLGYRACSATIILSLDDDIELVSPGTIERISEAFAANPSLGAVTLKIVEEDTGHEFVEHHWWHPRDRASFQDTEFETDCINEAAVAFRAEALEAAGYYYEALFWGGEESDLVLGILDAGYVIHYLPIPALHLAPRGSLNVKADYRHALLVRNRFWVAIRRLPPLEAAAFIMPRFVLWLGRSIRYGYLGHYVAGVGDLVRKLPEILRDRKPVSRETRRRVREIRKRGG